MIEILVPLIVFSSIVAIVKLSLDYKRDKQARELRGGDGSMRLSELKAALREVVEEANAPLVQRVERLERRLPPPTSRPRLTAAPETPREEAEMKEAEMRPSASSAEPT